MCLADLLLGRPLATAVFIPELVEPTWYTRVLHNHRSAVLKALLLFKGDRRITVINSPWYLVKS